MPRKVKDRKLDSREARSKLKVRGMPYYAAIGKTDAIGYRRLKGKDGTWHWRRYVGDQNSERDYEWTALGVADDLSTADGDDVLTFWQAQDKARELIAERAKTSPGADGKIITVAVALDRYKADLEVRGADVYNVGRIRIHLKEPLAARPIALLTVDELRRWRDGLRKMMAPASVNRAGNALRAALNLAADNAKGAVNRAPWEIGLKAIPGSTETRNVVLSEAHIRRLITEAPKEGKEFGLFVEVAAETGARPIQIARLLVRDLKGDRLEMPSSKKGRGEKKILRREVPIPAALVARLREAARGKPQDSPLLTKASGEAWSKSNHSRPFQRVVQRANLDPNEVTIYALRHSSITRQLKAAVPIRIVAALHDTSVAMIERTYSAGIDKHVDAIVRGTLLDMGKDFGKEAEDKKVVSL
jgi:integrase